jgi:hypothetical protein
VTDSKKIEEEGSRQHLSPFPMSRLAPSFDLVDLAKEIARADEMLSLQTNGKLTLLAEQIRGLQEEARKILQQAKKNQELHKAECTFSKKAGQVYHLYVKSDGRKIFSLLSPAEWGARCPYTFEGAYRLESDMSWTDVTEKHG